MSQKAELTTRGITLMERLKDVFPEKSGEAQAWNFRKFHDILHAPIAILFFGWIETTSSQSGEFAQKYLLNKALAENLNNSNYFSQFLVYWVRIEQLMRAERENAEAVGERHGVDADADDEAENAAGSGGTQDARSRSEAMHGCELGP